MATDGAKPATAGGGGQMLVSVEQLAGVCMVTHVWIRKVIRSGHIPAPVQGKVPLIAGIQGYIRFLKDEDRRTTKTAADSRVRDARAREIELRTAREERELVPFDEAHAFVQSAIGSLVAQMNGLPAQITRDLNERRRIEGIVDAIRKKVADTLVELVSEYRSGAPAARTDDEDEPVDVGGGKARVSGNKRVSRTKKPVVDAVRGGDKRRGDVGKVPTRGRRDGRANGKNGPRARPDRAAP